MSDYTPLELRGCAERLIGADALILTHKNPDADTVGSALALCEMIRLCGGRAHAVCADPIPERLAFLLGDENLVYIPGEEEGKCVIAADTASPSQLGALENLAGKTSFMIDHHAVGTPFADYLRDSAASSAGEIVWSIARYLSESGRLTLTPRLCRLIYAAISSDTGSFKYSNTSPATHEAAAQLTAVINSAGDGGEDTAYIARLLFDTKTPAELRANALAAQKLTMCGGGKLALIAISLEDCRLAGVTPEDCSSAVDVARSVAGVCAGVSIKEKGGGEYRISARSNCDFDVAEVCALFGGGGHVRAAGASVYAADLSEAAEKVTKAFEKAAEKRYG